LEGHALALACIGLEQPLCGFGDEAALLLDDEDVAGAIDDDEVSLSEDGVAALQIGSMNGVVDRITLGLACRQDGERLDFALGGACDRQFAPAVWNDLGHGLEFYAHRIFSLCGYVQDRVGI
jgi:hypothetical protein